MRLVKNGRKASTAARARRRVGLRLDRAGVLLVRVDMARAVRRS